VWRSFGGLTAALVVACAMFETVGAQTTPQELLQRAKVELDRVSTAGADQNTSIWIDILKKDFSDLQSSYGAQASTAASGEVSPGEILRDWRSKYAAVASDLVSLDAAVTTVSRQLRSFRELIDQFYAAADPKAAAAFPRTARPSDGRGALSANGSLDQPASTPTCSERPNFDALAILDRIQSTVDRALGTSGQGELKSLESAGKVQIDRAMLAEIRANIGQLKAMLNR
jgi:hypothetical protein